MKKQSKKADKFSLTEVGVLIEAIRAEFLPYLKLLPVINKQLDNILELFHKHRSKVASLAP